MDARSLALLLKQTLEPSTREAAEEELSKIHKIIGFAPGLLQVIMTQTIEQPVRQAGAVYIKNMITCSWMPKEGHEPSPAAVAAGQAPPVVPSNQFSIHEQDKALIRESMVDAMVHAPDVIRTMLAVCVQHIIKNDFPHKWSEVVDKISIYLQTPEPVGWPGALSALYQLVKTYEYKKKEERLPLNEAMNLLLPLVYGIAIRCLSESSQEFVEVRKAILKIFYALTQYVLPLDLISREVFTKWMELLCMITEKELPPNAMDQNIEEEERPQLIWWKEKKWALHIFTRTFERYGSPGNVSADYQEFSEWFLKTFSQGILTSVLKVLDAFRRGVYVSPRVMQLGLNYVNTGVSHSLTWKLIKAHIVEIIKDVLFPLMSYTAADAEMWKNDPFEYVRVKFDVFEDFVSPVTAAQTLLHSVCKKRKDVLPKTMSMLLAIVQDPNSTPSQRDGALHMIGTMADILLKNKNYKEQLEQFLVSIVFPEFASPHGHLRARACWMLHYFADVKFKNQNVLGEAFRLTISSLLSKDEEVPVQVEAAIALQMMLTSQDDIAKQYVEPKIREITMQLLKIIRDTENDDLTSVMQKIVCCYTEQLVPVAIEMCTHLVETFAQILKSSDDGDDKAITAMGLLNTIETIITVMDDQPEVLAGLEPIILQAVHHIFTNSIMEFYEEALSLTSDLTSTKISDNMWGMLTVIYNAFTNGGLDYFTDMMPVLHNYVTVDTARFFSNKDYPLAIFNMCKQMLLDADPGEDPQCHAAKLLEVVILQAKGHNIVIDPMIPSFIEVVFVKLGREIKTSELRTMCLQVAISAMYYNSELFFQTLKHSTVPGLDGSLIRLFIGQWIKDTDCFIGLHDRKVCALGLCQLMSIGPEPLPILEEFANMIMPSLLLLFDGLKHAYEAQREQDSSDEDSDSDGNGDAEDDLLESDEDEIDEDSAIYLESLQEKVTKNLNGNMQVSANIVDDDSDEESDDEYGAYEDNSLESYTTPLDDEETGIDEYFVFKSVLQAVKDQNPVWYSQLMAPITNENLKSIEEIFTLSDQRMAARESKKIEKQGGYIFNQQSVPCQFNFAPTNTHFTFGK